MVCVKGRIPFLKNGDTPERRGPKNLGIGRYEAGQWKPLESLVRTTLHATLIPVLCADRNRNGVQICW